PAHRKPATSVVLPLLTTELWPASAYDRDQLPERVLQFGSGMLLRALCVAAVDSANRTRARAGRIVVVQSTAEGAPRTRALNAQDGLFTLVERGLSGGAPLERIGKIGAISRALSATEPYALCAIEADPAELRTVFPIESASVVFAPDISFYRERKLRLLNAVHTATAPVALLAGIRTVREAIAHPLLGAFQKHLL